MVRRREGTWPKIIRAEELLASVKAEADSYTECDPYRIVGEFAEDRRSYTAWCVLSEEPPIRLSVLIGEFIYDLRSALDHLADFLVRQNGGRPTKQTRFPIYDSRFNRDGTERVFSISGGVSETALALIEGMQPYKRGENATSHPLSMLGYLSNADKHRNLVVAGLFLSHVQVTLSFRDPELRNIVHLSQSNFGRFENGAPVAHFPFAVAIEPGDGKVEVNSQGSPLIAFKEPGVLMDASVLDTLSGILTYVRDEAVRKIEQDRPID